MTKIWGRNDGSNVIKVMWCVGELAIAHERIDWGGDFGGNDDPEYRAKNPNGRLPTLEEEDGFTLWESGAIIRYLCAKHAAGTLWPGDPRARAAADKWMDWSSLNFAGFNAAYLDYYFRLSEAERDPEAMPRTIAALRPQLEILEAHLARNDYLGGSDLTIADFPAGSLIDRWMRWTPNRPVYANVEAYYDRLAARPAYQAHVIQPNDARTTQAQATWS